MATAKLSNLPDDDVLIYQALSTQQLLRRYILGRDASQELSQLSNQLKILRWLQLSKLKYYQKNSSKWLRRKDCRYSKIGDAYYISNCWKKLEVLEQAKETVVQLCTKDQTLQTWLYQANE